MLSLSKSHPNVGDSFETLTIALTPDNRILVSKKPHSPFHKYKSPDPKPPLPTSTSPTEIAFALQIHSYIGRFEPTKYTVAALLLASHLNCNNQKNSSKPDINKPQKNSLPPLPSPKKFTRSGRHTIMSSAGALDKVGYKPEQFWFFTGTLPGSSDSACEALARYSRYAVNRLKQALRNKGLHLTFNTWEWQKRDSVRGNISLTPALHLHLVVVCPPDKDFSFLPDYLREKWFDLLDSISDQYLSVYQIDKRLGGGYYSRTSPSVVEKCCRTIQCTKNPAAYLSKYVGKSSSKESHQIQNHCKNNSINLYYPSSWWSVSRSLRKIADSLTYTFSVRVHPSQILEVFEDFSAFFSASSALVLKKYSPKFYPDYWYQSLYVPSAEYRFTLENIKNKIDYVNSRIGVRELSSMPSSPRFDDVLVEWIHLPANSYYYDSFVASLPFYYRNIDWESSALRHHLRKYYDSNISEFKELIKLPQNLTA